MLTLYSTWPDRASALSCARALIEAHAAGCATVLPGATSVYRWKGAIESDEETVLLVKTTRAKAAAARVLILSQHPYELPCLTAWPIEQSGSNPAYLSWLQGETASEA